MYQKYFTLLFILIPLFSCTSTYSGNENNTSNSISTEQHTTETKKSLTYFEPAFNFVTFFLSDFYDCNKKRLNYIMQVKLQCQPHYPDNVQSSSTIVYDYRPKKPSDFQVIVTAQFDENDNLWYLKLQVCRNATLEQDVIRLSLFKTFDKVEEILSSKYGKPWLSMNSLFKEDYKKQDELYRNWLTVGESMIEKGHFISRWYTVELENGQAFDLMSLELTPDLIFEMYPLAIKEKLAEKPFE